MIINALLRIGFVCSKTALAEVVICGFCWLRPAHTRIALSGAKEVSTGRIHQHCDFDNSSNKSSLYTHDYKCLTENWLRLFKNCSGGSSNLWILLASAGAHPYCSLTILAKKTVPISMKLNGLTENWLRLFKNVQSGGTGHPRRAASDTMLRSPA